MRWVLFQGYHHVRDGGGGAAVPDALQGRVPATAHAAADTEGTLTFQRARNAAIDGRCVTRSDVKCLLQVFALKQKRDV